MGRPKQFDPEDVVERAMRLFWSKGYEATSVSDLVETLGVNRFSLYETFGDKRGLFLAALERYTERVFARSIAELEADGPGLAAIERYFQGLARWAEGPLARQGCLLVNTTAEQASHDRGVRNQVKRQVERVEAAFLGALQRAEQRGELRPGLALKDRARTLALVAQGCLVNMIALRDPEWVASAARTVVADLRG